MDSCKDWKLKELVSLLRIIKDERELVSHLLVHLLERVRLKEERRNDLEDFELLKELIVLDPQSIESLFVLKHRVDHSSDQEGSLGL